MAAHGSFAARLAAALSFASKKHRSRRRGDTYDPVPRDHHLDVARLLMTVGQMTDEDAVLAGVLHDVLELTVTTRTELDEQFGAPVRRLVEELTCPGDHAAASRRQLHMDGAPRLSRAAQAIRLADAVAILEASQHLERADQRELANWASHLVAALRGANLLLLARLDRAAAQVRARLDGAPFVPSEEPRPAGVALTPQGSSSQPAAPPPRRSNSQTYTDPLLVRYAQDGVGTLTFEPIDGRRVRVRVDALEVCLSIMLAALLCVLAFADGQSADRFPAPQPLKAVAAALAVRTGRSHSVHAVVMALRRLQDALYDANINPCFVDRLHPDGVRFLLRRSG